MVCSWVNWGLGGEQDIEEIGDGGEEKGKRGKRKGIL
jgi:hypothetical protein